MTTTDKLEALRILGRAYHHLIPGETVTLEHFQDGRFDASSMILRAFYQVRDSITMHEITQQPKPYAIVTVEGGIVQGVFSTVQSLAHDVWDWDNFADMDDDDKREWVQSFAPVWDTLKVITPGLVRDSKEYMEQVEQVSQ